MVRKVTALWILGITLSITIISCCSDEYTINGILSISVYEIEPDSSLNYMELDTVSTPFTLVLNPDVEILSANIPELIPSATATTCEYNFTNTIVSLEVNSDRPFTYLGDTISAGSDFAGMLDTSAVTDSRFTQVFAKFNSSFLQNAEFETGEHEFEMIINTSDNQSFGMRRDVYLNF